MNLDDKVRRIKIYWVVLMLCNEVSNLAFVLTRPILRFGRRVRVGLSEKRTF